MSPGICPHAFLIGSKQVVLVMGKNATHNSGEALEASCTINWLLCRVRALTLTVSSLVLAGELCHTKAPTHTHPTLLLLLLHPIAFTPDNIQPLPLLLIHLHPTSNTNQTLSNTTAHHGNPLDLGNPLELSVESHPDRPSLRP